LFFYSFLVLQILPEDPGPQCLRDHQVFISAPKGKSLRLVVASPDGRQV